MTDLRQDPCYPKYMKALGWETVELSNNYIYLKQFPLGISFAKLQRPSGKISPDKLKKVVKKNKIIYFLVEPRNKEQLEHFKNNGFKKTKSISLPSKTIQIDPSKSDKKLLKDMHHKARYNIGLSERRGVKIEESKDIEKFSDFWHECSKSWGMRFSQRKEIISLYKAFGNKAVALNAEFENQVIASVLLVSSKDTTYYMYAASNEEGNRLQAPSLLVWDSIKFTKKNKKRLFDFGGIYDDRFPLKKWKGFTEFKRKFGGNIVKYPSPLRKYFLPF